jgi:hypothetical protein
MRNIKFSNQSGKVGRIIFVWRSSFPHRSSFGFQLTKELISVFVKGLQNDVKNIKRTVILDNIIHLIERLPETTPKSKEILVRASRALGK